jgi:hypothetical protein
MKGFGKLKPFDVFSVLRPENRTPLLAFAARLGIFFWHRNAGVDS